MEEPRVVELSAYRVVKLRYEGPPPPDAAFFEHWRRFRELTDRLAIGSAVEDVEAIGYAPPFAYAGRDSVVYDACVPVAPDFAGELDGLELGDVPGGRYVLCAGPVTELPLLLQRAKRYAMAHGLAIERGWIELYRPLRDGVDVVDVDVGYRIHD